MLAFNQIMGNKGSNAKNTADAPPAAGKDSNVTGSKTTTTTADGKTTVNVNVAPMKGESTGKWWQRLDKKGIAGIAGAVLLAITGLYFLPGEFVKKWGDACFSFLPEDWRPFAVAVFVSCCCLCSTCVVIIAFMMMSN